MADHHHPARFSQSRDLERGSRDRPDPYRERDRDRDPDRSRVFDRKPVDHGEREGFSGRNNGHGAGLSSLIVRADSGGSAGYGRDPYDHVDAVHNYRHEPSQYGREDRFAPAGMIAGHEAETIYISNVSENVTEESLTELLRESGSVKVDQKTGVPIIRIYRVKETGIREAEVILDDPIAAMDIAEWLDGYVFEGSKMRVSFRQPTLSSSPKRHRRPDSYGSDYDREAFSHGSSYRGGRGRGPSRGRSRSRGRGRGRFGDHLPPPFPPVIGMVQDLPPFERDPGGPGYGPENEFSYSGDSFRRNNPNVAPREGDWICSEPTCGNLNFSRRTHCNNCGKPRREIHDFGIGVAGPPDSFQGAPHADFIGPPGGRGVERGLTGFGPSSGGWNYGGPARKFEHDFNQGLPPRMNESYRPERDMRDRPGFHDRDDYQSRERFDRPPMDRGFYGGSNRNRDRNDRHHDKRGLDYDFKGDKRQASPQHMRWGRDIRERSRSPERRMPRNYHFDQCRDDRRDERIDH